MARNSWKKRFFLNCKQNIAHHYDPVILRPSESTQLSCYVKEKKRASINSKIRMHEALYSDLRIYIEIELFLQLKIHKMGTYMRCKI